MRRTHDLGDALLAAATVPLLLCGLLVAQAMLS